MYHVMYKVHISILNFRYLKLEQIIPFRFIYVWTTTLFVAQKDISTHYVAKKVFWSQFCRPSSLACHTTDPSL